MIATLTRQDYDRAFDAERLVEYPAIDAIEQRFGYAVDRDRLESAARVLACPVKANPPNWQHGRVLYALARTRIARGLPAEPKFLDLGTAKGFSALCLRWAMDDTISGGTVITVDVIDPHARVTRNTVAEVDGLLTLSETLAPWPEQSGIFAHHGTSLGFLKHTRGQFPVVFVDGKHDGQVVAAEAAEIAKNQRSGDVVMWDDVHLPDVKSAVQLMRHAYDIEWIDVLPKRAYAIGVRR